MLGFCNRNTWTFQFETLLKVRDRFFVVLLHESKSCILSGSNFFLLGNRSENFARIQKSFMRNIGAQLKQKIEVDVS